MNNLDIKRNYGIDLLKIISMFMIVLLHALGQGGILESTNQLSFKYEIAWFLEIIAFCSTNCYAIISGYVGINSKYKYSNITRLWITTFFYTSVITIFFFIYNSEIVGIKEWINAIFPVMTCQYWYFTAYFGLFFLIPLLNIIIDKFPKKIIKRTLLSYFILFSVMQTVFHTDIFGTQNGYSLLWLIFLYLLGGYLKKYNIFNYIQTKKIIICYIVSILLTFASKLMIEVGTKFFLR